MTLTNTGKVIVRDAIEGQFVNGGLGLSSTVFSVSDTGVFGGGTTIDACDSSTGWSTGGDATSVVANTTSGEYQEGSASLNLSATLSSSTATYSKTISSTDLSGKKVALWIYLDDVSNFQDSSTCVGVVLGTSGFTNTNSYYKSYSSLVTGWNSFVFDVDSPDATSGSGATGSSIDRFKLSLSITSSFSGNSVRMDYIRYYESGTLGITDSIGSLTVSTGNYYIKTTHLIDATKSNGLRITEAVDTDGSNIISRVVLPATEKGLNTEIQVDKYYYIEEE